MRVEVEVGVLVQGARWMEWVVLLVVVREVCRSRLRRLRLRGCLPPGGPRLLRSLRRYRVRTMWY